MTIYTRNLAVIGDRSIGDSRLFWISLLRIPFEFSSFVVTEQESALSRVVQTVAKSIGRKIVCLPENQLITSSYGLFIFGCDNHQTEAELSKLFQENKKPVHVQPLRKVK